MAQDSASPRVSVVIPCFNAEEFIHLAVDSAFASTVKVEVICIDNNSADNTWSKLIDLKAQYPELIIEREGAPGANHARNKGLSLTTAEFVQFLDADDLIQSTKLEHQLQMIAHCDVVVSPYLHKRLEANTVVEVNEDIWKGLFKTELGITSSCLFRKAILEKVGGWDVSMTSSQEYDLMFRLLQKGARFKILNDIATIVNQRVEGQISTGNPVPRWTNYLLLRERILMHLMYNEPAYFEREKKFYLQNFFDILHSVYPFIPALALEKYNAYIKGKFNPSPSTATSSSFIKIMNVIGFRLAEVLKSKMKA